jgi:hypothetical protein
MAKGTTIIGHKQILELFEQGYGPMSPEVKEVQKAFGFKAKTIQNYGYEFKKTHGHWPGKQDENSSGNNGNKQTSVPPGDKTTIKSTSISSVSTVVPLQLQVVFPKKEFTYTMYMQTAQQALMVLPKGLVFGYL